MLLAKEGNLAGALALVDSLEPKTSDDLLQVILSKGEYLRQSGRYEEAFEVLTTGASHVAPEPELFNLYASVANQIGRYDAAENATRAVIAIAPGDSRAYNNLSFWLAERNIRLEEALLLASKALEIAPDDAYVMDTMGYVQYRLGNFNAAEVYLRRSNSLLQRPEVALHLAEVLLQKGEREEAQKLLREASVKAESTVNNDQLRHKIERLQLSL